MKYGVMENVLKQSWEKMFSEAKRLGFNGLELDVREDYKGSRLWSLAGREFIETSVDETGLEVRSICLHLLNNRRYSPASPDESERRRGVEVITQAIGVCKDIGAKVILIPFFGAAIISSEETKELLIAELQKCAETAEVEEVYLAVESTLSAEEALKVVRSVDSPYVKVYFDVGNALWQGYDPVKEIEALGKEIVQVHIKDTQNKPLGEGQVNLKAALGALRKIGYDGYLVLETPSVPDPIKAAKANLEYLKKQMP